MSFLSVTLAVLGGAVLGVIGAYYYTIWKTKKIMAGLFDNMGNLADPEKKADDGRNTGTESTI